MHFTNFFWIPIRFSGRRKWRNSQKKRVIEACKPKVSTYFIILLFQVFCLQLNQIAATKDAVKMLLDENLVQTDKVAASSVFWYCASVAFFVFV